MSEKSTGPVFDPNELGERLVATPVARLHNYHGEGFHYALGPDKNDPHADLEVYPQAKLIRYTSEGFSVVMKGEAISGSYEGETVIFSAVTTRESRLMTINPRGELLLTGSLATPIEEEIEPPTVNGLPEPIIPTNKANDDSLKEENEKQEKVSLLGRAGRDAALRETAKGVKIAKFPLAVHGKDEAGNDVTSWHTIVSFNKLAEEVADSVKKGTELRVVGYKHERVDKDKTIEEIYAAIVKPPTKRPNGGTAEEGPIA